MFGEIDEQYVWDQDKWNKKEADAKCKECLDDMYPMYGRAPHYFLLGSEEGQDMLKVRPRKDWPDNFVPDDDGIEDDYAKCGIYYCTNFDCANHKDKYIKTKGV